MLSSKSTQHKKNWGNTIKLMIANSEVKHRSKTMVDVIRGLVLDFVLYFATVWESNLYMQFQYRNKLIHNMASLNLSSMFFLKNHTENYRPTHLKKRVVELEAWRVAQHLWLSYHNTDQSILEMVAPRTLLKLYWK